MTLILGIKVEAGARSAGTKRQGFQLQSIYRIIKRMKDMKLLENKSYDLGGSRETSL